jgi:hypothetical protein
MCVAARSQRSEKKSEKTSLWNRETSMSNCSDSHLENGIFILERGFCYQVVLFLLQRRKCVLLSALGWPRRRPTRRCDKERKGGVITGRIRRDDRVKKAKAFIRPLRRQPQKPGKRSLPLLPLGAKDGEGGRTRRKERELRHRLPV